jgi:DNA-binding LacI/PurR family transcriptional regulator
MNPREGSLKVNFSEIARELKLSPMTIYRVVNNAPLVRRETRARVIEALNEHGYYTHKSPRKIKVLFDFTEHKYLKHYGMKLMQNITKLNYKCFSTNHRKKRSAFENIVAECDVAVFISIPDDKVIDRVRKLNPDIYTITISTRSNADVTISPNNTMGGELVAQHLHAMGHAHVAVHLSAIHPTRMERYKAFYAEMKLLNPACRIDPIIEHENEDTAAVLHPYFASKKQKATALFFLAGAFAEIFLDEFINVQESLVKDISIITFDRPEDLEYKILKYNFDRIEFISKQLLDWAEYYITNRPMMKKRVPVHTSIKVHLVKTGSVKKIVTKRSGSSVAGES